MFFYWIHQHLVHCIDIAAKCFYLGTWSLIITWFNLRCVASDQESNIPTVWCKDLVLELDFETWHCLISFLHAACMYVVCFPILIMYVEWNVGITNISYLLKRLTALAVSPRALATELLQLKFGVMLLWESFGNATLKCFVPTCLNIKDDHARANVDRLWGRKHPGYLDSYWHHFFVRSWDDVFLVTHSCHNWFPHVLIFKCIYFVCIMMTIWTPKSLKLFLFLLLHI